MYYILWNVLEQQRQFNFFPVYSTSNRTYKQPASLT